MEIEELSDLFFVPSDVRQQCFELLGQHLHSETARLNNGRVAGQRLGGLDPFQARLEVLLAAALMAVKELTQLVGRSFFGIEGIEFKTLIAHQKVNQRSATLL